MSGRTYQTLQRYKGSLYGAPQYTGIEYDYEVPDNIVVASPGGVSDIQHHWTHGMYGNGATTYDVYAGEGNAYPYAELGNLYQQGQNAPREMGMYMPGTDQMYTGNQSTAHVENFQYAGPNGAQGGQISQTKVPGMEMIAPPDTSSAIKVGEAAKSAVRSELQNITHEIHLPNPWLLLLMFVLLYVALDFLMRAGETVLFNRFHGGATPHWKWLLLYAGVLIAITVGIGMTFKDPLMALKKFEGDE